MRLEAVLVDIWPGWCGRYRYAQPRCLVLAPSTQRRLLQETMQCPYCLGALNKILESAITVNACLIWSEQPHCFQTNCTQMNTLRREVMRCTFTEKRTRHEVCCKKRGPGSNLLVIYVQPHDEALRHFMIQHPRPLHNAARRQVWVARPIATAQGKACDRKGMELRVDICQVAPRNIETVPSLLSSDACSLRGVVLRQAIKQAVQHWWAGRSAHPRSSSSGGRWRSTR